MIAVGFLSTILAVYATCYVRSSSPIPDPTGDIGRTFDARWQCVLYWPATKAEAVIRGVSVFPMYRVGQYGYTTYPEAR